MFYVCRLTSKRPSKALTNHPQKITHQKFHGHTFCLAKISFFFLLVSYILFNLFLVKEINNERTNEQKKNSSANTVHKVWKGL